MVRDSRVSYHKENCENLSFASQSFDLVFCKEGLHHLARPVQGLYEMLRVSRKAVIFVESYDGLGESHSGSIAFDNLLREKFQRQSSEDPG